MELTVTPPDFKNFFQKIKKDRAARGEDAYFMRWPRDYRSATTESKFIECFEFLSGEYVQLDYTTCRRPNKSIYDGGQKGPEYGSCFQQNWNNCCFPVLEVGDKVDVGYYGTPPNKTIRRANMCMAGGKCEIREDTCDNDKTCTDTTDILHAPKDANGKPIKCEGLAEIPCRQRYDGPGDCIWKNGTCTTRGTVETITQRCDGRETSSCTTIKTNDPLVQIPAYGPPALSPNLAPNRFITNHTDMDNYIVGLTPGYYRTFQPLSFTKNGTLIDGRKGQEQYYVRWIHLRSNTIDDNNTYSPKYGGNDDMPCVYCCIYITANLKNKKAIVNIWWSKFDAQWSNPQSIILYGTCAFKKDGALSAVNVGRNISSGNDVQPSVPFSFEFTHASNSTKNTVRGSYWNKYPLAEGATSVCACKIPDQYTTSPCSGGKCCPKTLNPGETCIPPCTETQGKNFYTSGKLECTENGIYKDDAYECKERHCDMNAWLDAHKGTTHGTCSSPTQPVGECQPACDAKKYRATDPTASLLCGSDDKSKTGATIASSFKCTLLQCTIQAPDNGTFGTCSGTLNVGSRCTPACQAGYGPSWPTGASPYYSCQSRQVSATEYEARLDRNNFACKKKQLLGFGAVPPEEPQQSSQNNQQSQQTHNTVATVAKDTTTPTCGMRISPCAKTALVASGVVILTVLIVCLLRKRS